MTSRPARSVDSTRAREPDARRHSRRDDDRHDPIRDRGCPSEPCCILCNDWTMTRAPEPRLSFNDAAEVYDEIRPNYPAAMFNDLFRLCHRVRRFSKSGRERARQRVDLLGRGATVHAVEIAPAMAAKLRSGLRSEDLHITVGDFEIVEISERMDTVFSATAYHWISAPAHLDRPAAILKPRAIMAIVDLNQVASPDDDGFFEAAQPIYERYGQGHTGPRSPTRDTVDPPIRRALTGDRRFIDVEVRSYDWNQTYTASEYRKLMQSYSVTNIMEPSARRGLLDDMEAFIVQHFHGRVTRPLVVTLTTAVLA